MRLCLLRARDFASRKEWNWGNTLCISPVSFRIDGAKNPHEAPKDHFLSEQKRKTAHRRPDVRNTFNQILIFRLPPDLAPWYNRLPGFIGPFPPPLLIRLYAIFEVIIHAFSQMSTLFRVLFPRIAKNGIPARHSRPIVNAEVPKVQYLLFCPEIFRKSIDK